MSENLNLIDAIRNYKKQKKILQDRAIKMEMRRMYRKRMVAKGALFIVAAVLIAAAIRWCWL